MFGSHRSPSRAWGASGEGSAGATPASAQTVRVLSIDELARKYDFTPPDEYVGTESSRYVLDYGPPVVLSDTSRKSKREEREDEMWQQTREYWKDR